MNLETAKTEKTNIPLGTLLLRLRGATQNLIEAFSTNDLILILQRRIDLSEVVQVVKNIELDSVTDSLIILRIVYNMKYELNRSESILSDASSYLSAQLVLV